VLTALTPPVKAARENGPAWFMNVISFTLAGMLASAMVGALLGAAGQLLGAGIEQQVAAAVCLALALVIAAGELELLALPIPQARRASKGQWAKRWGQPAASVLWGFDIGLYFSTWLTYGAAWWLAVVAVLSGDSQFAAALFGAFWLGRALPVWLGPWLMPSPRIAPWVGAALAPLRPAFRRVSAAAVLLGGGILMIASAI